MSWKKHFTVYQGQGGSSVGMKPSTSSRFQSWLPEVYSGQPNRVERYAQYGSNGYGQRSKCCSRYYC